MRSPQAAFPKARKERGRPAGSKFHVASRAKDCASPFVPKRSRQERFAPSDRVMTTPQQPEYVLGTGADELERLGFQHRLWSDAVHALWKTARVQPGTRVLDVGCGPGYASFDLAQLVGHEGKVLGVDESQGFVAYLNGQAKARGLEQLSAVNGDVQQLDTALGREPPFDFAFARWVLCYPPRPQDVIAGVARSLRPGGRFAIVDYFNYEAMTMAPRRASYSRAVSATARSWRARGGDPDIVSRLPRILRDHGLEIEHFAQHQ